MTSAMLHADALRIATTLQGRLRPYCDRIEIGGSVRRGKPEVHDIELVAIPRGEQVTADLFGGATTVYPIQAFLNDGVKSGDWKKLKGGEKYVQLAMPDGINVDLYLVTPPAQWGVIFTLRNGHEPRPRSGMNTSAPTRQHLISFKDEETLRLDLRLELATMTPNTTPDLKTHVRTLVQFFAPRREG